MKERTGKHKCIKCLASVAIDRYLSNDHICDDCVAAGETFPFASTEGTFFPEPKEKMNAGTKTTGYVQ